MWLLADARTFVGRMASHWNQFWFEANGYAQMRLYRRGLALLLLVSYSIRSLDLEVYYSDRGLAPLSILSDIVDLRYRYSLFFLFPGVQALWWMNGVFLLCLIFMIFGFMTRLSSILVFVLHVSFLHRNLGSVYGADTVATFFLGYLCLADFRYASGKERVSTDFRSVLGSLAFRLSQIQLCVIYAYAGIHKLKGFNWWNGEAVWAVLANSQMARWDFSWMAQYPMLFILPTYATLFFEIYFPVLVWSPRLRRPLLGFGLLLHLGIGLAMNIPIFAVLMALSYGLFLDEAVAEKVNTWFEGLRIPLRPRPFL